MELEPRDLSGTASETQARTTAKRPPKTPSVRQVFALAAVFCQRERIEFPATRDEASELIERLRLETRHPRPRREDAGGQRERRVMRVR